MEYARGRDIIILVGRDIFDFKEEMVLSISLTITLTRGRGSNRDPSFSSTNKMTKEEMNPTSCVFPPATAWMEERERLPAAVKELKKLPMMFMMP